MRPLIGVSRGISPRVLARLTQLVTSNRAAVRCFHLEPPHPHTSNRRKKMIERYIKVDCDNCDAVMEFYDFQVLDVYSAIRSRDWAVSKNRKYTFCPKCKIKVTSPGRNGYNKLLPFCAKKAREDESLLKFMQEEEERMRAIYLQECEEFARMNSD